MSALAAPITVPAGLVTALESVIDARLAAHGLITPPSADTVAIDGEAYLIRRSVGHPTVLVQVATAREVELPAPVQAEER